MTGKKALLFLLDIGMSYAEIASRIRHDVCSLEAIQNAADQLVDSKLARDLVQLAHEEAHCRARAALERLLCLRVSQKEIALELGYSQGTISRARNDPDWPVGLDFALAMAKKLAVEEDKRAAESLARVPLTVIDTCPDRRRNMHIDGKFSANLVGALKAALKAAFTNSLPSEALPDGCLGALASVGAPDIWLFMMLLKSTDVNVTDLRPKSKSVEARHLRTLVHELHDLIRRLQGRIDRLEGGSYRPDAAF